MIKMEINEKGQFLAPCTERMGIEAFAKKSGCVDAPDMLPFNGNPERLFDRVVNPKRIRILAPGEKYK